MLNSIVRRLGDPVALVVICGVAGYGLRLCVDHPDLSAVASLTGLGVIGVLSLERLFSNVFRESPRRPFRALLALAMLPAYIYGANAGFKLRHEQFFARCQAAVVALEPLVRNVEAFGARTISEPGLREVPAGYEGVQIYKETRSVTIDFPIEFGHITCSVPSAIFPPAPDGWVYSRRREYESGWLFPRRGGPPWRVPSEDAVGRLLASPGPIPPETSSPAEPPSRPAIERPGPVLE